LRPPRAAAPGPETAEVDRGQRWLGDLQISILVCPLALNLVASGAQPVAAGGEAVGGLVRHLDHDLSWHRIPSRGQRGRYIEQPQPQEVHLLGHHQRAGIPQQPAHRLVHRTIGQADPVDAVDAAEIGPEVLVGDVARAGQVPYLHSSKRCDQAELTAGLPAEQAVGTVVSGS